MTIFVSIDFLLQEFERSLYLLPVMIICTIIFVITAIAAKNRNRFQRLFLLYGIYTLVQDTACLPVQPTRTLFHFSPGATEVAILIFILAETIFFYIFFYTVFNKKTIKTKVLITGVLFILYSIAAFILYKRYFPKLYIGTFSGYYSVTSSVLLLLPSFYYYFTLLIELPSKNLTQEPSFWITTGILFLHAINLPFFLIEDYLIYWLNDAWYNLYSINYLAYSLLFLLLTKSMLCKIQREDHLPAV